MGRIRKAIARKMSFCKNLSAVKLVPESKKIPTNDIITATIIKEPFLPVCEIFWNKSMLYWLV